MFSPRSMKRRRISGQDGDTQQTRSNVGDSGEITARGSPTLEQPSAEPSAPLESPPNAPKPKKGKAGPGRPIYDLNERAKRGLIRLFVDSPESSNKIEAAVTRNGGPGRLWLRNFRAEFTGAGKGTNLPLKDARMKNAAARDRGSGAEDPVIRANEEAQGGADDFNDLIDFEPSSSEPSRQLTGTSDNVWDGRGSSSEQQTALPRRDPKRAYSLANPHFDDGGNFTEGPAPADITSLRDIPRSHSAQRERDSAVGSGGTSSIDFVGRHQPQLNFVDPTQNAPQMSTQRSGLRTTRKKAGRIIRKRDKRRATTMSLQETAIDLDGGKKGQHYRLAKSNTISRQPSTLVAREKLRKAETEFNPYYQPTHMDFVPPTPSTYPLSPSLFRNRPPPKPVAMTTLMKQWAKGTDHLKDDEAVREELELKLLQIDKNEHLSFVSAADEKGVAPLHLAVAYGYPLTCRLLIEYGASPDVCTKRGTSIYDFAEPAARRTGSDMRLYFRILHCRKFVHMGKQPPAPDPKNLSQLKTGAVEKQTSRTPKEPANPEASLCDSRTNLSAAYPHPQQLANSFIGPNLSSSFFPGDFSASPASSSLQKQHSLPFSDDETESHQKHAGRRTTVSPLVSPLSYQSGTSLSGSDRGQQISSGIGITASAAARDAVQPTHPSANEPASYQSSYGPPAFPHNSIRDQVWTDVSAQSAYASQYSTAAPATRRHSRSDQNIAPMQQQAWHRQEAPTNAFTAQSFGFGSTMSFQPQQGYSLPGNSGNFGPIGQAEASTNRPPNTRRAQPQPRHTESQIPQNIDYNQSFGQYPTTQSAAPDPNYYSQFGMSQASNQPELPIVSTAAHYSSYPAIYHGPPSNNSPMATTLRSTAGQQIDGCVGLPYCHGYVSGDNGAPASFDSNRLCDFCANKLINEWTQAGVLQP